MAIATGVFKKVAIKKQSALGTPASGASAKYQRRITSTLSLKKASYQSQEIRASQMRADMRHGVRSVSGSLNGELSVGGYQSQMESVCRQAVQTASTSGAIATVTAAVTSGAAGTFTRSGGDWMAAGFKVGDVVTSTGWATTGVPNNSHYSVITALTALIMTVLFLDGVAMGPKAAGDSVTFTSVGKKTWVPATGQTRDYYSIEEWHSDISQSEFFTDCVFTGMNVTCPASGMATVEFPVMGLNKTDGTAEVYTSPTAAPTGAVVASANGALIIDGSKIAVVTAFTVNVNGNYSAPGGVVGSNVDPDIFPGVIDVTGSVTILFENATQRDKFTSETEASLVLVLTGSNVAAPAFVGFTLSRVKFQAADKDDGNGGLSLTMPFTALENTAGGASLANLQTVISIQDSAFA